MLLVLAGILVLVGAILIGKWVFSGDGGTGNGTIAAPNFVGLTKADAEKQAVNSDLKVTFSEDTCEDQPKGKICDQTPEQGTEVDKQSTVELVVSTGAPKVEVPDVEGLTYEEAEKTLKDKGFEVEKKTQESTDTPDTVLSQDPEGGTSKEKGSTVTVTVARQTAQVTVPDVTGKTPDEAKQILQAKGLVLGSQSTEESTAQEEGKIFEQSFAPGTDVDRGSTVDVKIAKKPAEEEQKFAMPKVTDMTVAQAKQVLGQAGLQLERIQGAQDDNAKVVASSPSEGQEVKKGDKVTLIAIAQGGGNGNNGGNRNIGGIFGGLTGGDED
ncbi:non-specific serine/threonine protein kinase OS=Streptomyces fumanus OX=67302 GN=GCM10018772_12260 PE=4 SV=1 [Streptomyces fumanus]